MSNSRHDQMLEFAQAWEKYDRTVFPTGGLWADSFPPIRVITEWRVSIYAEMTAEGPRVQARRQSASEGAQACPWRATFEEVYADAESLRQNAPTTGDMR